MTFRFKTVLGFAAIGAVIFAVNAAGSTPARAMDLVHGSWPPATTHMNRVAMPKAFKAVEEATHGEIKWKLVAGGQLASAKESFKATGDGLMQGGMGISVYVPNLVPSLNTIYSTIVFEGGPAAATGAAMETFYLDCPSCIAEFKKINIVPLAGWTSSQYYLACRDPIKTAADLKGKRLRGFGGYNDMWKLADAVPIAATLGETVTLLQRGALDCMIGIHAWLKIFGYGDFAKFITDYPMGLSGPAIGWMINRDSWNKMTGDQKMAHIKQSAYISAEEAIGEFINVNNALLKDVMDHKNVKMVEPEKAGFKALTDKYVSLQRENNIAAGKKFGVAHPEAIIDAYNKNLAKWQGLVNGTDNDVGKFTDLIWQHVYSKIDVSKF